MSRLPWYESRQSLCSSLHAAPDDPALCAEDTCRLSNDHVAAAVEVDPIRHPLGCMNLSVIPVLGCSARSRRMDSTPRRRSARKITRVDHPVASATTPSLVESRYEKLFPFGPAQNARGRGAGKRREYSKRHYQYHREILLAFSAAILFLLSQ